MKSKYIIPLGATIGIGTIAYLGYRTAKESLKPKNPRLARLSGETIATSQSRVLAITAHPDDLEFFAGGLLSRMETAGSEVSVINVTNGEKGTNLSNLAPHRQREQCQAAKVQGYKQVFFLGIPDMKISQHKSIEAVANIVKQVDPTIIVTFDYEYPLSLIRHPDHHAVGDVVDRALKQISYKGKVLYYATSKPNTVVDISMVIKRKIRAILAHDSQIRISPRLYPTLIKAYHRLGAQPKAPYVELLRIEKIRKPSTE